MEQKKKQNHKLYGGFQYAFAGIVTGLKQEQNMKMHAVMTALVVIAGFFFHISMTEWCICLLLCGLIMALELVNTAVEAVVDLVTEERKPLARYGSRSCIYSGNFFSRDRMHYFSAEGYSMDIVFARKKVYE